MDTSSTANTCGVFHYRSVIQKSRPQPEDTSTTANRHRFFQNPESAPEHHNESKHGESSEASGRELGATLLEKKEEKKGDNDIYLYISDDSSTERSCSLRGRKKGRSRKGFLAKSNKETNDYCQKAGDCSDKEDGCHEDDTADSSSDSERDMIDSRLLSHKQKMKGWKKLAQGKKFEEMLLECIVNTGELLEYICKDTYQL